MSIDIIAEIAGGHLGKLNSAIKLIELAKESNANSVKFQFYKAKELCEPAHPDYELFKSLEFEITDWKKILEKIRELGLNFYADVFGMESFEEAESLGADGFKIHTADLDNRQLLEKIAMTGKIIFLGIGGRKRIEILEAIKFTRSKAPHSKIFLMPGHQLFPTPPEEHWLTEIRWFAETYRDMNIEVGCADHIDGDHELAVLWPLAAVGAGVRVIEKHLTLDRSLKLEDYESALDPDNFRKMVTLVRALEPSTQHYPQWSNGREKYRKKAIKRPLAINEIQKGEKLTAENVGFLRSNTSINPIAYDNWINKASTTICHPFAVLDGKVVQSNVGILVNARSNSTRLPRKALKKINNKETILHLLERVRECRNATDVVFCTTEREDDNELAELVSKNGFKVFRGPDEQVAERLLLAAQKFKFDHIVRVTGDDLLRDISLMEKAIDSHLEQNADYTDMVGVVYSCNTEVISTRALKAIVERATTSTNTEYLSWYLDDESAFNQNILKAPAEFDRPYRLTLDTQEDFDLFEKIFKHFEDRKEKLDVLSVLAFLDENPGIADINKMISPKLKRNELDLNMRM